MSIKKLLLSALLLTTTGFAYAQDNCVKLAEGGVIVATVDDSDEGKINLDLYNDQDWCAMQFDLYLPENVTFPERGWRTVTSRLKYYDPDEDDDVNFTIATNPQADGAIRFVIYNVLNEPIQGNSGDPILKLRFIANDQVSTGKLPVIIKNVILSNSVDTSTGTAVVSGFNAEKQETDVTVKINAKVGKGGYGSFSWPRDVVFGDDVEVFTATSEPKNGWLHLEPITDKKVPAGTGVFIKGTEYATVNPETTTEELAKITSTLGQTSTAPYEASAGVFVLATKNEKTALYPVGDGVTIPQYKAYVTGESGAKFIALGDTATSIDALDMAEEEGDIYTLGGQKVQKTTMKGVYIKNGKKVVVK